MVNISVNTQAVWVEALYKRPIMASFHGLWSLAGFAGAAIGTLMIGANILPFYHFVTIAFTAVIVLSFSGRYLLNDETGTNVGNKLLAIPDKSLLFLGLITFSGMICEGAMFDWSGIYFQKVVQPSKEWVGAGYTAFMLTMATGRFIADWFAHKFGLKATLQLSGGLIASGLLFSVVFPNLLSALVGFLLVGFGVSSVVPLVYSAAGKSKTLSPGLAIAAVSTIGFFGFLLGPPVIGFIAEVSSLRVSFTLIALMGITVAILSSFIKKD
jgi:predicted MFS family arabinose efflux permease